MDDRTTIATQLLAALVNRDGVLSLKEPGPLNRDDLTDEAIILTDLLLAKLNQATPAPKPRLLGEPPSPKWQCLSFAKPERYQPCRVVVWDSDVRQVKSIDRLYWDGDMWEDGGGDCALGDVPDLQIYWCPSHLLPNYDEAIRVSFIEFIEPR